MNVEPTTPDADQLTANTAFVAIDKGLLSGKVSEQVEAIVKFPSLFDRHPFPLLINSSMLKLADVFRVGSNFTRLCILRVCQQSERHLDKILNVDEVVRRIFSVIHSNDPVARGLALSTLGSLSAIIPQRKQVHHSIRQSLDARDPAELEAGILAAGRFAAVSKTFATNISERVSEMVQSVTTPVDTKLKLLNILQHMHHDTQTAATVRQLCVRLLPSFPSEQFVTTTLRVLTKLAAETLVDIPEQVELLLGYLTGDVRRAVKAAVLSELLQLSRRAAPLWSPANHGALIRFAAETRRTAEKAAALAVLVELARSVSVRQFDLAPDGPLMRLCQAEAYHEEAAVAGSAVQLLTALAVHCQERGVRPDVTGSAVAACDSLLLLLTSAGGAEGGRRLRAPLRCAVSLASDDATAALLLESVGGLARAAPAGPARRALLEALCAVGSQRPHVLAPLASDVLALLEAPDTDGDTTVQLCTLLLQLRGGSAVWPDSEQRALAAAAVRVSHWQAYKIARQAMRYGHHGAASRLLGPLLAHVSTEQMQFWLSALLEISEAEALLAAPPADRDMSVLSEASQRYARGLATLRASTSPTEQLEFPVEFCRLRWRSLQAHIRLWSACRTLQTSPPPACVANAGAAGARDDSQRSGRVTAQLQKSGAEFSSLADDYGRLHRASFDADPDSLAGVERLQRCCHLVAQAVGWAVRRTSPETVSAAACPAGPAAAAHPAEEACARAAAVVARAHQLSGAARGVDHRHTAALLAVSRLLTAAPLRLPRRFFQTLQRTVISLSVQPQPRSASEPVIAHPITSQLVVKIDGVVGHGRRGAVFRSIAQVQLRVTAALQGKPPADSKAQDTTIAMSRTVEPHNDYFHGQFLLDLRLPGIHVVTVDAHIVDADGIQWLTSSTEQLTVRAIDETQQSRPSRANSTQPH
ncbi:Integrator complex subunit 7 [Amphibalanus amphitrite]|uniref:Integrator complex subunit 7 n=1 Tax=Amphibalanus amphitrite TaxID=1232801 RepID=A0A6A4WBK5_AMPAM|nr:integrator complex subunit 7-like [Amphibalanus amphitrite]XP_043208608.1 integrator complex subunit 7-like [Amphibalanus amphitrite]KAF0300302.1 Integrator complex subunit 7 [Amphibalanus amphitrite]